MWRLTIYCAVTLLCTACKQQAPIVKTKAELIEEGIQSRLRTLTDRKMQDCKEDLLAVVISDVDSTIARQLRLDFVDTIAFPRRPQRPRIPGGKIVLDTSPVTKVLSR